MRGQHDDRPDDVGQHVEEHDARPRRAQRPLGLQEGPLLDRQRLRARDAAELRHEDDGDEDDDVDQPRPEHRDQRQRQDQAREGADDVEDGEDRALDRRRRVGRGDAEQDAERPAPSPSPRAPRRRRCACRTGRAKRGRGRDDRRPASGSAEGGVSRAATSIWFGKCVAISGASKPAEHDDQRRDQSDPAARAAPDALQNTSSIRRRRRDGRCRGSRGCADRARRRRNRPAGWSARRCATTTRMPPCTIG